MATMDALSTFALQVRFRLLRRSDVFEGQNGLILTGILTGIGTLVCLILLTCTIVFFRKKYKKRHGSRQGQSSFDKLKERVSSDVGHPVLTSRFSHTPPLGGITSPFQQAPFQIRDRQQTAVRGQLHHVDTSPHSSAAIDEVNTTSQSDARYYSSRIPFAAASTRGKHSQTDTPNSDLPTQASAERPSSYLPVPRGLTPLSMSFIPRGSSFLPSASFSGRPPFETNPSSELLHGSQMMVPVNYQQLEQEVVSSPFQNEKYAEEASSSYRRDRRNASPAGEASMVEQTPSTSTSGPQSMKLNFSYPTPVMRSSAGIHAHSHSTGHAKSLSSRSAIQHLRNRSNGTVITYASSVYTNLSDATAKIQPVVFNDSPRSSTGGDTSSTRPPGLSRSRSASQLEKHDQPEGRGSIHQLQMYKEEYSGLSHGPEYRFAAPRESSHPTSARTSQDAHMDPGETSRKSSRRASGKLPDVLFARTASCASTAQPNSPMSRQDEDLAALDDRSLVDPMDLENGDKKRQNSHFYPRDLRGTSNLHVDYRTSAEARQATRPGLASIHPSEMSFMSSTSSTATSRSFYGMAV